MYEKSDLAKLSHVRSDLFPFRSCIKGQPRLLVAVTWWLCHAMGDGMADPETSTHHFIRPCTKVRNDRHLYSPVFTACGNPTQMKTLPIVLGMRQVET